MKKVSAALMAFALLAGLVISAGGAEAKKPGSSTGVQVPIAGTTDIGSTFDGTFTLTKFVSQGGELMAVGTLTGDLTDVNGDPIGSVTDMAVSLPVANNGTTCDVLDLTLGPLDLDLLGLVVHLDQVNLTIDAQQGPGNLLGNLLCAVTGLLDGNGSTNGLSALLNQILSIL